MDKKSTVTLPAAYMETLALLTRMRLEFCEEQGTDEEYAEEAADLRTIGFALAASLQDARRGRPRYVVEDVSQYVRPDGGRFSMWQVMDRKQGCAVEYYPGTKHFDTRREARDHARELNDAL